MPITAFSPEPHPRKFGGATSGSWKKGESGNPAGPRNIKYIAEIKSIARQHGAESIALIMDIARNLENPPAVRLAAAIHILDRGYGKPESHASVAIDGGDVRQLSTGDIIRLLQARGIVPGQDQDAIEVESEVVSEAPSLAENEG